MNKFEGLIESVIAETSEKKTKHHYITMPTEDRTEKDVDKIIGELNKLPAENVYANTVQGQYEIHFVLPEDSEEAKDVLDYARKLASEEGVKLVVESTIVETGAVTITDYMQSRRYNRKIYDRLVQRLESIADAAREEFPGIRMEIDMSAKYQTPIIIIKYDSYSEEDPGNIGYVEQEIMDALDDVGFTFREARATGYGYEIDFSDE